MSIEFHCHTCNRLLRTADEKAGRTAQCPGCGEEVTVPDSPRRTEFGDDGPSAWGNAAVESGTATAGAKRTKECPVCGETILASARKCRYCGEVLGASLSHGLQKPEKVTAIAVMMLAGGIISLLFSVFLALSLIGLCWPGTYYGVVLGVFGIVSGSKLLSANAHWEKPPTATAVMQIVAIINLDIFNLVMGIINLVFLKDPEVEDFFYS